MNAKPCEDHDSHRPRPRHEFVVTSIASVTFTPLWTLTNRSASDRGDRRTTDDHTGDLIFPWIDANISNHIITEKKHGALSVEQRMKSSSTMNVYEAHVSMKITRETALVTDEVVRA